MQIQKEEIRNSIIESAKKEFYNHGFEKTSLRKIVKDAGTTIGNFYNYFNSKEELFMIIAKPAYEKFLSFMKGHDEADDMNEVLELDISVMRALLAAQLKGFDDDFQESLVILIDGSSGTPFENIKDDIQEYLTDHFMSHLENSSPSFATDYYKSFSQSAAKAFMEGFLDILRRDNDQQVKRKLIEDFILFFTLGTGALLNTLGSE